MKLNPSIQTPLHPSLLFLLLTIPTPISSAKTPPFDPISTGCCPADPAYPLATLHPNATGTFSIPGLHLEDSQLSPNNKTPPFSNWTWTTTVSEVLLSSQQGKKKSATNQIYTLDVPLDVDVYGAEHERNVCVVLLDMLRANWDDPGDCGHIFDPGEVRGMVGELTRRVGEMSEEDVKGGGNNNKSPCSGLGGSVWQEIISPFHRANHSSPSPAPHNRNTTTIAQYHSTSPEHDITDFSAYDHALVRTQPILLLGYSVDPKVLSGPKERKEELVETRLVCVRVQRVEGGSRGAKESGNGSGGRKVGGGGLVGMVVALGLGVGVVGIGGVF
ncbi:hypothetical protein FQN50_006569 [Emmonsiellopsis sp. PD_5]|nr:hypothetical protein FQN50_006569 [Emmonsiellopsis sp. PD_5]